MLSYVFSLHFISIVMLLCSGFLPPEFINNQLISKKYDIFSLGAIIKRIVTGAMDKESIPDMDEPKYVELVRISCLYISSVFICI